ncbi:MAG: hypothetical protein DRI77_01490 [Chloroflexi bacterium]|nr:MAG: hypothetical protein DRI77_01490 [Chloroflexota bacterium]
MTKKAKKRVRASKELTRKQLSRLERERRIEKWLLWSVVALVILVVGVLGYGFFAERIVKAREPVVIVEGDPITTADFQARVRFTREQLQFQLERLNMQQLSLDMSDPSAEFYLQYIQGNIRDLETQLSPASALSIGKQVLDQLIVGKLVHQEAERRGITVAPEQVQQSIEQYFGYERDPATPTPAPADTSPLTPTVDSLPTPTPVTEEAFQQRYSESLKSWKELGISEQQFRSWMEDSLVFEKLREQMDAEVPTTADQVKLSYISVDSEEWAKDAAARLDAGEDFQALADELEDNEDVTGYGRELDWYPSSVLQQMLGEMLTGVVFDMQVGERSQPVLNMDDSHYYIVEILGRETRELAPNVLQQVQEDAFQKWVEAQQQVSSIEYPPVRAECHGDTPWYKDECRRSWRDRDPEVCRWALLWPCGGSWQARVPMDP